MKTKLWVAWWKKSTWDIRPFTGNESWDVVVKGGEYGEMCVLIAAASAEAATKVLAESPQGLKFPEILVA